METEETSSFNDNKTEKGSDRVLFVKFDNFGRLCIETERTGFCVYKISFQLKVLEFGNNNDFKNITIFESFDRKKSVYVTSNLQRSLCIHDLDKNKQLERHIFTSKIVEVKISKLIYFTFFTDHGYVCNTKTFERLQRIDKISVENFVCCISPNLDSPYLAYTATNHTGILALYSIEKHEETNKFHAHKNSIRIISFNSKGNLLATCSELGTLIRLFSIPECEKLKEFRRGTINSSRIDCLSFCDKSEFLAVTGSTKTVHLFLIKNIFHQKGFEKSLSTLATSTAGYILLTLVTGPISKFSFLKKTAQTIGKYVLSSVSDVASKSSSVNIAANQVNNIIHPFLPKFVTDVLNEERASLTFKCTEENIKRVCYFVRSNSEFCLVLVGENGYISYRKLEEDKLKLSLKEK